MGFSAGSRVGPYEIVAPLGAGGMGAVFRARDTRLDRTVAIKILSEQLAADADSRQRFEQEARAIAALNDPHICTIHDVGHQDDIDYIVLEFLQGETLHDRLLRAPRISIAESVAIAIQIADALDRAHRAGIAHRDLKPGNVMLVAGSSPAEPHVKLLDFGLAARTAARPQAAVGASLAATLAPSLAATQAQASRGTSGFSGTVQYMAPEQIDGDTGDVRVDIFAFGCVLYEMLAGRKAFEGTNALAVIAAVMNTEPAAVPELDGAHPLLAHVLRRCLEKDRDRRWQSIHDVASQLRWIVDHPWSPPVAAAPAPPAYFKPVAIALALVTIGVLTFEAARVFRGSAAPAQLPLLRYEIPTPPTDTAAVAISPDGAQLAFVANQNRVAMVWVRALDAIEARPLAGTDGASLPFWSPDGRTIGFFADGKLKRVDVSGGAPLVIADAPNGRGGTWSQEGIILFAPGVNGPVMQVSTTGGPTAVIVQQGGGGLPDTRWPQFLPDGRRFIFSSTLGTAETNGVYLASLDGSAPVRVLAAENAGRFAAPDKLLTVTQDALRAYTFDVAAGAVQGDATVLAQGVAAFGGFAASDTGILVYRVGTALQRQLTWVDRTGKVLGTLGEPDRAALASPELSPDERYVAVIRAPEEDNDIWIIEVARGLARRITDGPPADAHPMWDPTGSTVVFSSRRFASGGNATRQSITGGPPTQLVPGEIGLALNWSRDGRYVLMRRGNEATGPDLFAVPMMGGDVVPVAQQRGDQSEGQFSPDARWVAFVSDESGRPEVFVQSFPEGAGRTQVSTAGGMQVRWSADGREVFFVAPDGKLMAAPVNLAAATADVSLPVTLFQTYLATGTNVLGWKPQYAVARDGRFLLNTAIESASTPIVVSVNWTRTFGN